MKDQAVASCSVFENSQSVIGSFRKVADAPEFGKPDPEPTLCFIEKSELLFSDSCEPRSLERQVIHQP